MHYCSLFSDTAAGSAFLLDDSKKIYTNLHSFNQFLYQYLKVKNTAYEDDKIFKAVNGIPLFMQLVTGSGDLIFDSRNDRAILKTFNPRPELFYEKRYGLNHPAHLSDIVELNLNRPTNLRVLKRARRAPKTGEMVYLVGFPTFTSYSERHGVSDSDGGKKYISMGRVISFKSWKEKTHVKIHSQEDRSFLKENMIFGDFSIEKGNSGGPILNKKGEVVGVVSTMWRDFSREHRVERIGGGLKVLKKAKLDNLWHKLSNR